jgi:hypothetical protein
MFGNTPLDPSNPWFSAIAALASLVAMLALRDGWRTVVAFLRNHT